MTTIYYILLTLFIVLALFLMLLVLIQKGRGGGLASAFGGMGGNTAFGSKTGDVLTWATSIVFGIFIVLAVALNLMANYRQREANRTAQVSPPQLTDPTTPAPTTAPAPR